MSAMSVCMRHRFQMAKENEINMKGGEKESRQAEGGEINSLNIVIAIMMLTKFLTE